MRVARAETFIALRAGQTAHRVASEIAYPELNVPRPPDPPSPYLAPPKRWSPLPPEVIDAIRARHEAMQRENRWEQIVRSRSEMLLVRLYCVGLEIAERIRRT